MVVKPIANPAQDQQAPLITVSAQDQAFYRKAIETIKYEIKPLLANAPVPVQDAMKNDQNSIRILEALKENNLAGAVAVVVEAAKPSLIQRAKVEQAATAYFTENQPQLSASWVNSNINVSSDAYVEANTEKARQESMARGKKFEQTAVELGIAVSGDLIKKITEKGQAQDPEWLKKNGREMFDNAQAVGYTVEALISVATFLDGIYNTSIASTLGGPSPVQTQRMEDLTREQQDATTNKLDEIQKFLAANGLSDKEKSEEEREIGREERAQKKRDEEAASPDAIAQGQVAVDLYPKFEALGMSMDQVLSNGEFMRMYAQQESTEMARSPLRVIPVRIHDVSDATAARVERMKPAEQTPVITQYTAQDQIHIMTAYRKSLEQLYEASR